MERNNKPGIFKANEAVLEKEAEKIQNEGGGPTSSTTTAAPTSPTTTKSPLQGPGPTSTTTTIAPTQTTTTAGTQSTTTTAAPQSATAPTKEEQQQVALNYLREQTGNPNLTLDDLIQKYQAPEPLTEDQKKIKEQQDLVALQKAFVDSGKGTIDDFHRIRNLATIKDEDLVRENFRKMAKEMNDKLTDKEIDEYFDHQYFLGGDKAGHTESEILIGQKRIAAEAAQLRTQAALPLTEVQESLKLDSESVRSAQEWRAKAKTFMQNVPKSYTIPLGKVGETQTDLGNFTYNLSAEDQQEIGKALEDPSYLLRSIADPKTGKTDPQKLFDFILWQRIGPQAARIAGTEQYSKGMDVVMATLDNRPNLSNTGDRRMDGDEKVEEGKKQILKDADNVLGRGMKPRQKSWAQ